MKCEKGIMKKDCSDNACAKCCQDKDCLAHQVGRAQNDYYNTLLERKHEGNIAADRLRASRVTKGKFNEPAFHYIGDTFVIWSLKDYFSNDKALNDALHRSKRRRYRVAYEGAELMKNSVGKKKKEGRNSRFKRKMEELRNAPELESNETVENRKTDSYCGI